MDMTERDDEMLMRFFEEHKQELLEEGFSARVMQKLPCEAIRTYNRLWTLFCCVAGLALVFFTRGWEQVAHAGRNVGSQLYETLLSVNLSGFSPLVVFVAVMTFLGVTVYNLSLLKD